MNNDNIYVSWITDSFRNNYLNQNPDIDHAFFHYLTPFSNPYIGPLNPILLFCGYSIKSFNEKSNIMLRDGLIPLTYFFSESKPEDFNSTFYLPAEFCSIVPKLWRPKVKFYRVKASTTYHAGNLPRKILLVGTLNSTFADRDEFKAEILNLVNSLGGKENLKNIEIAAYFSFKRNDLWGHWDEENILEYSKVLFNELKMDISFPPLENILSESGFKDVLYYEVNRGYFISSTYTAQHILSRGAGLVEKNGVSEKLEFDKSLSLSLHHQIDTYQFSKDALGEDDYVDPFKDSIYLTYRKFFESFSGSRHGNHWDGWFASYVKNYYKNKKLK